MRALIKDLVQTLCAIRLFYEYSVFFLILIFIIRKSLFYSLVDLLGGHFFNILHGKYLRSRGVKRYFSLLSVIPEGGMEVISTVNYSYNGYFVAFYKHTYSFGDK